MRALWCLPVVLCLAACGRGGAAPAADVPVVGVWVVDVAAYRASFVKAVESKIDAGVRRGTLPPDEADLMRTQLLQDVHDRFVSMWARFTLREDGTFASEGSDGTLAGRWGRHGARIELTVTAEDGVETDEPTVWPGTVEGGVMTLRPEADKDYEVTLRPAP